MDPNATRPLDDPSGKVFGGARMANVGGSTFVNIDGENATSYILINQVFGGNDIAGTIGTAGAVGEDIPGETLLTAVKRTEADKDDEKKNAVDNTFNSYVRISTKTSYSTAEVEAAEEDPDNPAYGKTAGVEYKYTQDEIDAASTDPDNPAYGKTINDIKPPVTAKKVYIGQLFGGGNGDFDYEQTASETPGKVIHTIYNWSDKAHQYPIAQVETDGGEVGFQLPELNKTYLEIKGGSIVYGYGGGNNATVKEQNIIHIDNPSAVVNYIWTDNTGVEVVEGTAGATNLLTTARFKEMGINTTFSQPSSGAYQVGRFFGGNNKAEMSIRPTWNLLAGKVRNLYSGGNKGSMTSPEGLLLEIKDYSSLIVDNLYGGCRMADVMPTVNGEYKPCLNLEGYAFPNGLSARVLVAGGHINNVYGGNDVTGTVYGGNAVGIHTSVYGNVYGGGNGAYPYTDVISEESEDFDTFGDFRYDVTGSSTDALNAFRPNAEQVSIHLLGKSPTEPTAIRGSVFVGGNCASLSVKNSNPLIELKIGSYVVADNIYLGNNGEGMIDKTNLEKYADNNFSTLNLTNSSTFAQYMEGVAMTLQPRIVFDRKANGDRNDYIDYSSYVGSFFCGGNVGSMAIPGKMEFKLDRGLNIYTKLVGGCNNANVDAQDGLNAAYYGGIIGSPEERGNTSSTFYTDDGTEAGNIKDRLEIEFQNMTVVPMRWNNTFAPITSADIKLTAPESTTGTLIKGKEYYTSNLQETKFIAKGDEPVDLEAVNKYYKMTVVGNDLEWNTAEWSPTEREFVSVANNAVDADTRFMNCNVYGGCYNSGHVNGNVILNIEEDILLKDEIFGTGTSDFYGYPKPGVDFEGQRDDVLASALYVYGAGHGEETEIWGSATINHNNGYAFQLFGGGEQGAVGKKNGSKYEFDKRYSTIVNLNGNQTIYSHEGTVDDLAETEYIYGGGNQGVIAGNTLVNLGNGRIYDAFGGSSDADILGQVELYVGRQPDGNGGYKDGFPWIIDNIYGGNDFGGTIHGEYEEGFDFTSRVRDYENDKTQIHGNPTNELPGVLKSSTYVEYLQGRVDSIFGGSYGYYDYADTELYDAGESMPKQTSAFVNIRPKDNSQNYILHVYGAGTGHPGNRDDDGSQDRSYVLVDIPDGMTNFGNMEVFGAGSYNGLGMRYTPAQTFADNFNLDEASAIVDLLRGRIRNVFGGSYQEGITRRTVVNVPAESSIQIDNIFGGAYGIQILPPCDVYETHVNYNNTSENAQVFGAIYGGNNNERRSLFTQVNISSPVYSNKEKGYTGTVYGAGRGIDTWSEHTEVNLLDGARVYNVFGGGEIGHVLNSASVQAYMNLYKEHPSPQIGTQSEKWNDDSKWNLVDGNRVDLKSDYIDDWHKDWLDTWTIGSYYVPAADWKNYAQNSATNLDRFSDRPEIDDTTKDQLDGEKKHNTNVIINKGAVVEGYAYGGGLGDKAVDLSGDVYGSTYIAVLGGEVKKDVYAGGRAGGVDNLFGATVFSDSENAFVATANAYIQGGTVRNVYGGGYEGHVGYHVGDITTSNTEDRSAKSYVVIGKKGTDTFDGGAPAITRNVYGGGEGGSIYGSSNVTINNGYIGYRYKNTSTEETPRYEYVEELDDQNPGDLELSGNVFGGGYVANSYVDDSTVKMYSGTVRGSLYGGGEIGPIGRGTMVMTEEEATAAGAFYNEGASIFKAGSTNVIVYDGLVKRNVFGGGRGKDSWGGDGTMYMDPALVATLDMKCKGFVFGKTNVNIYGGEIGTAEGMAYGYGNVFGGGDEGSVYSATGTKSGERYDGDKEGYYYDGGSLTEDCKVVVEPHCLAKSATEIGETPYAAGTYVPTSSLNTLKGKTEDAMFWNVLDDDGIIIHNAVFAGGNLAPGSSSLFANSKTVYGNATASIHDVYNRDLITIGTGHTGGLYGDGNLTFVDGYRELNITNYGTDYYHIASQLTYEQYLELPAREQAYYELKYSVRAGKGPIECAANNTSYKDGSSLPQDEIVALFEGTNYLGDDGKPNPEYWEESGVVTVYAGRIMNTIQRADFCGVFGSRMVMKGAQDRVPEETDFTNYTINRVREVSLNKKSSIAGDTDEKNKEHGNYFGIYSVVNYLGALTSDVTFDDVRVTGNEYYRGDITIGENTYHYGEEGATYYNWKRSQMEDLQARNNGSSHNQVALASGVYLELTSEKGTGKDLYEKDWGPITGIVELDLINVQPGLGGGFVYAKNIHGVRNEATNPLPPLTTLNDGAASQKDYTYDTTDDYDYAYTSGHGQHKWETSGNFIHSTLTIVDDCYNTTNKYFGEGKVPAHYWYIKGSVYVYDQYISAYTGSPNAYSETVEIPISISAASNGTMTLVDVQPNYYAYYKSANTPLSGNQKLVINDVTYQLNDPISYWDYNKLPAAEKNLFVNDTYVTSAGCKIGNDTIYAGTVMRLADYNTYYGSAETQTIDKKEVKAVFSNGKYVPFEEVFHSSNNMSHDNGYLLTYSVTNPGVWDKWYTQVTDTKKDDESYVFVKNQTGGDGFEGGPTYRLKSNITEGKVLGQQDYEVNGIIPNTVYNDYTALGAHKPAADQATFVPAYLITKEYTSASQHYYPGAPVSAEISGYTAPAYVCTATIQLSPTEYIYVNDLMTEEQKNAYYDRFKAGGAEANEQIAQYINDLVVPAYICTEAGKYGGNYYEAHKNYRALDAYSAMSEDDRKNFEFNYDALDLLIDPTYGGTQSKKYQYDSAAATLVEAEKNDATYSLPTPIDYTATYDGSETTTHNGITLENGKEYSRTDFESLPNEQRHYAPILVKQAGTYYIVKKEGFIHGDEAFALGSTISDDTYGKLTNAEKEEYITELTFTADEVKTSDSKPLPYYYCREEYTIGEKTEGQPVEAVKNSGGSYSDGEVVPVGVIIAPETYASLPNYQKKFTIHGKSPTETSKLFVVRNADINDLSTEKIITVIYKYDYEVSDETGVHITPYTERHVVNIHINFKSGVPTVEDINPPTIVLPGTGITMRVPSVTPGAYEITGGGWELFEDPDDAESHINGVPYTPSVDPLYWYQDGFYLAYYAKTYLGKTYSNHVPVSVANYHDLKRVMDDINKDHHMYIDSKRVKREPKIYINDYSGSSKDGLDLLKDLYDLSLVTASSSEATDGYTVENGKITGATGTANASLVGHALLDNHVRAERNLEFILRTDINHTGSWTPIGYDGTCDDPSTENVDEGITGKCFDGVFHGDGHTIRGLDNSLFNHLCGEVYNLGVTGSFNSAGVADQGSGYVESAWVKTTATEAVTGTKPYAVFGNPTDTKGYQVVNSYLWDDNKALYQDVPADGKYSYSAGSKGTVRAMTAQEFYNGTVAYDLNNFYLYKRYNDGKGISSDVDYKYWKQGETKLQLQTGYYANNAEQCSSGWTDAKGSIKYVEERFADGDFVFAAGEIPTAEDERHWIDKEHDNKSYYFPIWPDDYIFFGQKLTYGWAAETHQDVPTAVVREEGRLSTSSNANRVYRAPAYYRSKTMDMAHFNPHVYLTQKERLTTAQIEENVTPREAYPNMTAIDFKGHNDLDYQLGLNDGKFYTPLLDDDGLLSIQNCDETQNLVVYSPSADANAKTYGVLNSYFTEPMYSEHYDNSKGYRLVAEATAASVHGHLVQSNKIAIYDHLLVDKQDFNAPIAYKFDADHLMWYQRLPADREYVDLTQGWQGISIPFTAELVTTDTKGEITHFYGGSEVSNNGTKKGHEYWLRELTDGSAMTEESANVLKATFNYPSATGVGKTVTNTFLWDYYYENQNLHKQLDANADKYEQDRQYYKDSRNYAGYGNLTATKPYIIGFPGQTYYEFDLSGKFVAQNTAVNIPKLGKQVITFASNTGANIGVSDDEMEGVTVSYSGTNYTFKPSYMNNTLSNGDFVMNTEGSAYVVLNNASTGKFYTIGSTYDDATAFNNAGQLYTDEDGTDEAETWVDNTTMYYRRVSETPYNYNEKNHVTPSSTAFRPYFIAAAAGSSRSFFAKKIIFGGSDNDLREGPETVLDGSLEIYTRGYNIVTTSHLKEATTISIITPAGATFANYVLQPGETIETTVPNTGVYVVNKKKVFVE